MKLCDRTRSKVSAILVEGMTSTKALVATLRRLAEECANAGIEGTLEVREPQGQTVGLEDTLCDLYEYCDGIAFAEVQNGYFIDTASRVRAASARGEPVLVVGDKAPQHIVVFGSDGGGGRFALDIESREVLYLPSSGSVANGEYLTRKSVHVATLSKSVSRFLERVVADVRAFIDETPNHRYIGAADPDRGAR